MYVYVIQCMGDYIEGRGLYKVGKARNPEKRLSHLQIGCPYPLAIVDRYKAGHDGAAVDAEGLAHERLAAFRWKGRREWFRAPLDIVLAEVIAAVKTARSWHDSRPPVDKLPSQANGVRLTY